MGRSVSTATSAVANGRALPLSLVMATNKGGVVGANKRKEEKGDVKDITMLFFQICFFHVFSSVVGCLFSMCLMFLIWFFFIDTDDVVSPDISFLQWAVWKLWSNPFQNAARWDSSWGDVRLPRTNIANEEAGGMRPNCQGLLLAVSFRESILIYVSWKKNREH